MTWGEFVPIHSLEPGMKVVASSRSPVAGTDRSERPAGAPRLETASCVGVEKLATRIDVYDIAVEEARQFFANGILVHNCDELATWRYPAAFDNLLFGLRLGEDPRLCVTTTPKPVRLVVDLINDPTTAAVRGTTYDNRTHLAPAFFERVVGRYEGTRLGQQELLAEVLEVSGGTWFHRFDAAKHVSETAEYHPLYPVHLAIDCGVSRHVGAVWFQVQEEGPRDHRVTVFADYHGEGLYSEAAARAILARTEELPCRGRVDTVRLDPAASASTGIGPSAHGEYERIFGQRVLARWPVHLVADGLDQLEVLLDRGLLIIHPRCTTLKAAFLNYARRRTARGDWLDEPADPQHPHEDLMDALRGGVRDRFPEGRVEQPRLRQVKAGSIL
jgi:hypothetical protein